MQNPNNPYLNTTQPTLTTISDDFIGDELNGFVATSFNREPSLLTETKLIAIPANLVEQGLNIVAIQKVISEYGKRVKRLPVSKSAEIISSIIPEGIKKSEGFNISMYGVTIQRPDWHETSNKVTKIFNGIGLLYNINSDSSGADINIELDLNN